MENNKLIIPSGTQKTGGRPIAVSFKTSIENAERIEQIVKQTYMLKSELLERCVLYALDHIEII